MENIVQKSFQTPYWNKIYKLCRGNMDIFEKVQIIYNQLEPAQENNFGKWVDHYYILAHNVKRESSLYRVTQNSIILCEKVYKDLGVWIFPVLDFHARPGWEISGGTWAWSAQVLVQNLSNPVTYIGCSLRIKFCVQKRVQLIWGLGNDEHEVFGVLTKEYREYMKSRDKAKLI